MADDPNIVNLTRLTQIYPNAVTRKFLLRNIKYRNEIWNQGIHKWEEMYRHEKEHLIKTVFNGDGTKRNYYRETKYTKVTLYKTKKGDIKGGYFTEVTRSNVPSGRAVRDRIIDEETANEKKNIIYPSVVRNNTLLYDLDQAYKAWFNPTRPDSGKPKLKKQITDNGSYLDTQAHIKDGRVYPTTAKSDPNRKRYQKGIKTREDISDLNSENRQTIRFIHRDGKFYVAIAVKIPVKHLMPTGQVDGVDVNVDKFNSTAVTLDLTKQFMYDPKTNKYITADSHLFNLYKKIAHYQRVLANKRECVKKHYKKRHQKIDKSKWQTNNYYKIRLKLRRTYKRVYNIQHNIIQQYTTYLVKNHDDIYIERLDVKHMQMSHVASKGLHRSMFGYFRIVMEYKCKLFGRNLHEVDQFYPSTQQCPRCGMAKAGDEKITLKGNKKHHTGHNEFRCNYCGYTADRDEKVPVSLFHYNDEQMKDIKKAQRKGIDYQTLGVVYSKN